MNKDIANLTKALDAIEVARHALLAIQSGTKSDATYAVVRRAYSHLVNHHISIALASERQALAERQENEERLQPMYDD